MRAAALAACATALLLALFLLCLLWEWRISPLRPGGSWLVLKALPLLAPLNGLVRGRRYTYQWSALFILAYTCEGIVRAATEGGASRILAIAELVLSTAFFVVAIAFARKAAPTPRAAD